MKTIIRINDVEDPFYRMLAVVRFTFSKDLKFIVSLGVSRIPFSSKQSLCSEARSASHTTQSSENSSEDIGTLFPLRIHLIMMNLLHNIFSSPHPPNLRLQTSPATTTATTKLLLPRLWLRRRGTAIGTRIP